MKNLREGITTGTCVAAATKAALQTLLSDQKPTSINVALPPFHLIDGLPDSSQSRRLEVPVLYTCKITSFIAKEINKLSISNRVIPTNRSKNEGFAPLPPQYTVDASYAYAEIIKDGGDDPDATNGIKIQVFVTQGTFISTFSNSQPIKINIIDHLNLTIHGGPGIGTVTLPGLPVIPGEPAINPEPRKQLFVAINEEKEQLAISGSLHILVCAENGAERAKHTLNPRLGIINGISILGTQGTVRPFSHMAWKKTIEQNISVSEASGSKQIIFSTGRRSERFLSLLFPEVPEHSFVQAADFAAFSIKAATTKGFNKIIWGCFPGKLVKLAQGLEWTHAKNGEPNFAMLNSLWQKATGNPSISQKILSSPTVVGAFEEMNSSSPEKFHLVIQELTTLAYNVLLGWINSVQKRTAEDLIKPQLELIVFSLSGDILASQSEII